SGLGEITWYKAAHHGSKESNTENFLQELKPEIATISCGENNRYGHPAAEAVANIKDSGAKIYETTKCGQITIGYDELPAMKPKMKQFYSGISIQAQNPGSG
ncbi:MAG: hypothetical protein PUG47_00830, partial [Lachnospiraceae bacterium]|nr:hypothetical protein [Lachnospiraceae bacterium]